MAIEESKVEVIFFAALEKPSPDDRVAYLDEVCVGDPSLRQRVEALLNARLQLGGFLQGHAADMVATTLAQPATERPGTQIGPYKLLEQIGEGGMGVVYMAEQTEPVKRRVALKLIKPGMDTCQVIARFEAERQALAMMDHVNIARVLDAGTTSGEPGGVSPGRPYFVMELIHGIPVTKYCDDNNLTPRQRLELFVPVCHAIQHAHQKGIIHRDIKPSNVMITLYDGKPVPKVIDFGVAKATEQKLTERTLFTQYGTMVGTLEYMSPEQAEMSALGVDTRSDIYSLGVLLYELLTGSTPLSHKRMKEVAYAEILRLIKEVEPPRPSTRLSESGGALASISAQRQMEPAKLSQLMRGELDWIVMKTLEKDRNRRYETANGFAADVQRYLNDEAVQACPPSAAYRFRKFARRNNRFLAAAVILSVAIILGAAVSIWQAIRATRAEGLAEERSQTAMANYQVAEEERRVAETQRQRAVASETDAKRKEAAAQVARQDAMDSLKEALAAVDQMLTRVGQDRLANVPQMEPVRRELLQDALNFYQRFLQNNNDDPGIRRETAMAYRRLADVQRFLGQPVEAEKAYRNAIAMFEELGVSSALEPALRLELVSIHIELSWTFGSLGKFEEAVQNSRRAVQVAEKLMEDFPDSIVNRVAIVNARNVLAGRLISSQPDEAEKILRMNLPLADDPFSLEGIHRNLGTVLMATRRLPEAEAAYRDAVKCSEKLAAESPSASWIQNNLALNLQLLASALAANNRPVEADEYLRRAILVSEKIANDFPAYPEYRVHLAETLVKHAAILKQLGQPIEAEKAHRRALDLFVKLSADFPTMQGFRSDVANCTSQLGRFLEENNRTQEAVEMHRLAVDLFDKLLADFPSESYQAEVGWKTRKLATILSQQPHQSSEADELHCRSVIAFEKLCAEFPYSPAWPENLAHTHRAWGFHLIHAGQPVEAENELRKAVTVLQKSITDFPSWPGQHDLLDDTYRRLMGLLVTSRIAKESELALREIVTVLEGLAKTYPGEHEYRRSLASAHESLGRLFKTDGRMTEAEQSNDLACEILEKLAADFPTVTLYRDDLIGALCDLGNLLERAGRHPEAQTAYGRAVELNPTALVPLRRRASAFAATGQWEQYAADMSKVVELAPESAVEHNNLARMLATCPEAKVRDPKRAVELAKKAVDLDPNKGSYRNTLGIAEYRDGNWAAAIAGLTKSMELRNGGDSFDWFFLAMAHWQSDHKEEARKRFDQAVAWMEKNARDNEELIRFRDEASELMKEIP